MSPWTSATACRASTATRRWSPTASSLRLAIGSDGWSVRLGQARRHDAVIRYLSRLPDLAYSPRHCEQRHRPDDAEPREPDALVREPTDRRPAEKPRAPGHVVDTVGDAERGDAADRCRLGHVGK